MYLSTVKLKSDRGPVTGGLQSNPVGGLDAGAATFCCASPAFPLAEPLLETDSSTIQSTVSAVVSTPGYRHRVTFAVLPLTFQHAGYVQDRRLKKSPRKCRDRSGNG